MANVEEKYQVVIAEFNYTKDIFGAMIKTL